MQEGTMKEAWDFKNECDSIAAILDGKTEAELQTSTLFKGWTIHDIIGHLHLWNIAANQTLSDPEEFQIFIKEAMGHLISGKTHPEVQAEIFKGKSATDIYAEWKDYYPKTADNYAKAVAEQRVKWAGPDMSARSSIIARQMEHWAHAQAIFDVLGLTRQNEDRLKNVAHIGVTTYSWSFKVKGLEPIKPKPYVRLTAPSGAIWEWNDPQEDNRVEGSAEEFSQVVTQCRNIGDTSLKTVGEAATKWMNIAQCFAGGPETAPAKGARHKA